ncbi:hypothetical protein ACXN5S_08035 [Pseudoroseicyclus sp. H15]
MADDECSEAPLAPITPLCVLLAPISFAACYLAVFSVRNCGALGLMDNGPHILHTQEPGFPLVCGSAALLALVAGLFIFDQLRGLPWRSLRAFGLSGVSGASVGLIFGAVF